MVGREVYVLRVRRAPAVVWPRSYGVYQVWTPLDTGRLNDAHDLRALTACNTENSQRIAQRYSTRTPSTHALTSVANGES